MKMNKLPTAGLFLSLLMITSCATHQKPTASAPKNTTPTPPVSIAKPARNDDELANLKFPEVNHEFRAAWVATVANINWPSKGNNTTEGQKQEAIRILDLLKAANFNAVIFQARPSADALYNSKFEPWSYFLTGRQGEAPNPYYDPLEFWLSEAHKRGMELHVWLNPYRAHHSSGGPLTPESMAVKMGESVIKLKNGMYWMDPADQKVQDHASDVVHDLVSRYDIDGVHIDDYFYPYAEYNNGADFPDSRTWTAYKNGGGTLSKADWRRGNVNKFIKRIHDEIHETKPYVKFGISPFGIWKAGYPAGIKGSSQYDDLYADAKLWLNEGWCDYFTPQLYWKEGGPQSFSKLLKWWEGEKNKNVHLWPGLNTVEVRGVADRPTEISGQIRTARNILKNDPGEVHWSVEGLQKSPAMYAAVQNLYHEKAIIPASPWLKTEKILTPEINVVKSGNSIAASWLSRNPSQVRSWILYTNYGGRWTYEIFDKNETSRQIPINKNGQKLSVVAIKAVDRIGKESDYAASKIQP